MLRKPLIGAVTILAAVGLSMGLAGGASAPAPSATVTLTCNGVKPTSSISGDTLTGKCPSVVVVPPTTTTTVPPTTTTTVPPTTTTTTVAPVGGTCTKPVTTLTAATDTFNTDPPPAPQNYWVSNDAWNGSHGPQSVAVCSQSSWTATSNQPNVGGAVETYPDTEYDVGGRSTVAAGVNSTEPISDFKSITSTFAEQYPSAGAWDAAYDLWLNNFGTEIMVWNQWAGGQSFWPNQATITLSLGGVPYKFFNNGGELMFFRQTQVTSGSVDLLAAFNWLVTNGYVKSTDVPTQLEYGVEVCTTVGTETFPMTGLTFSVSP